MTLTYNDGAHRYRLDGRPVPNVTSILNGGLPKPALVDWAARTVAEHVATNWEDVSALRALGWEPMVKALAAVPNARRDRAAATGTEVHALAERVAHGDRVEVPPALAGHVRGYVDFLDAFNPRVLVTEAMVANRTAWYAGRFDLLAVLGDTDGPTWLLDVKTSRGVYGDTSLQLAAYARADVYVDPATGHELPMPQVDRIGVVHVTADGTDLFDLGDVAPAWDEFRAALHLYRSNTRRRNLIGDPVPPPDALAPATLWDLADEPAWGNL